MQYFTRLAISDADNNAEFADVALVQMYSAPDPELLQRSNHVVLASQLTDTILVIHIKQITGVIAMICQVRVYSSRGSGQVRTKTDEGQGQGAGQGVSPAGAGDRLDSTTKDNER